MRLRAPRLFVAVASVGLMAAAPVWSWPFHGPAKPAPTAADKPAAGKAASPQSPAAPSAPRKATAEERARAERMDPLSRATFWAQEVDIDPTDVGAGLKLSQALRGIGRDDEAAAAAERVLVSAPQDVEALLELGRDHIARGQGFYAVEPLEKAATLAPKDWRPLSLLGVACEQISRKDEAGEAWARALILSPDNPTVLTNIAMAHVTAGDAAGAEPLLRKAMAQPGATLQTRQDLALALGLQGKAAEAERLIRQNLPPELAEQNLAWLKARMASGAATRPAPIGS